jgi:predicted DsbA family dithiol-disulfide isomerase
VAAVRIEIASDVVCPWCYIGKRRFERALSTIPTFGGDQAAKPAVRHRSFLLDPSAPIDGTVPVRDAYATKFGGVQRAERILAQVTEVAATEGLAFRLDIAIRANTFRAHQLLALVWHEAPTLQPALNESIMRAYFCEGANIADLDVLVACAKRCDFDPPNLADTLSSSESSSASVRAVHDDLAWVAAHDVTAVPTFVFNDSFAVPGAQDTETFVRLMQRLVTS